MFALDERLRGFHPLRRHTLAAVIKILELLRAAERLIRIFLHEEFQSSLRAVQPAGRIEAGAKHEAGVITGERFVCQPCDAKKRLKALVLRNRRFPQPFLHQDPVFVLQRHDITDRSKSSEGKKISEQFAGRNVAVFGADPEFV